MACSNCYNGCSEIVSDKCIKYTGVDVPILDIKNGDSLSYVEQALVTFLTSTINGSGIKIDIDEELYCELISDYLQECSEVTALDLFKALVQAACNLQGQIDDIVEDISTIEANYTIDCLEGVSQDDGTHAIVQAVITKLCEVDTELTALATDVDTNYVKLSELNDLIQDYLDTLETSNKYHTRMVPYTIQAYYGTLSNFDSTGAGLGEWEDIYLCNGNNSTPDLRGRVLVGAISGVPGGAMSSVVNPASSAFNPNYALGTIAGANSVTLNTNQIPSHSHGVTDPEHYHLMFKDEVTGANEINAASQYAASERDISGNSDYEISAGTGEADVGRTKSSSTGISIDNTGGGQAHANIQPVLATYYIMYIP
jgi:microcystin-dependent protein